MKYKKSQIIGQVFIYTLILIVVVLVTFLGYKGIQQIRNSAENAQLINFKTSITSDANKMINDYGSIRTFEYNLPSEYYEICFMDEGVGSNTYSLIKNTYDADNSLNVYLMSRKGYILEKFGVAPLEVDYDSTFFPCIKIVNGYFKLKIQGLGDKIKIEIGEV